MTWQEYWEALVEKGCNEHNADNIVGDLMDLYEDWEWDNPIPFEQKDI